MRNATFTLTEAQHATANHFRPLLSATGIDTRPVTVNGHKRNGDPITLTGIVIGIVGADPSHEAVVIERSDDGERRSINLWNVTAVIS